LIIELSSVLYHGRFGKYEMFFGWWNFNCGICQKEIPLIVNLSPTGKTTPIIVLHW